MEIRVAEKYAKLCEACNRYPEIVLSSVDDRGGYLDRKNNARVYVEPTKHAKNGFIEKFCL